MGRKLGLLVACCLAVAACGDDGGGIKPRPYELSGRLLDAETGAEVSRSTIYLHFFCDEQKWKTTREPADTTNYSVKVPHPKVRVRAYDQENTYAAFEREFELKEGSQTFDIKLQPTHNVKLHGKVIDARTGKPIAPPKTAEGVGGSVLFYFQHEGVPCHPGTISPAADGTYSIRVPRGMIKILAVNTPLALKQGEVDLTKVTADDYAFDIELE
jgi:hypothetical protein